MLETRTDSLMGKASLLGDVRLAAHPSPPSIRCSAVLSVPRTWERACSLQEAKTRQAQSPLHPTCSAPQATEARAPWVPQLTDLPGERGEHCHLLIISGDTAAGHAPGLGQTRESRLTSAVSEARTMAARPAPKTWPWARNTSGHRGRP